MRNRAMLWIGLVLVLIGLLYLAAVIFQINLHGSIWAVLLIVLGVWLLVRPHVTGSDEGEFRFLGDVVRRGVWEVENQEYWFFIGDISLDMSQAKIPAGETIIRTHHFIGDLRVIAPDDLGIAVNCTSFISEVRLFGEKRDSMIAPVMVTTPGYENAARKVRFEKLAFIGGVKIRKAE